MNAGKPSAAMQTKSVAPPAVSSSNSVQAAAAGGSAGGLWRLSDMLARPDEFRRVLSREVLSGKQVLMAGVVMLEAPVDATHLQVHPTV